METGQAGHAPSDSLQILKIRVQRFQRVLKPCLYRGCPDGIFDFLGHIPHLALIAILIPNRSFSNRHHQEALYLELAGMGSDKEAVFG